MTPTRLRTVRIPDDAWDAAMERAELEHRTVSDVIRVALRAYGEGRYHAQEPKRRRSDE